MENTNTLLDLFNQIPDTGSLIGALFLFSLGPVIAVITTSFLKISVVLMLLRNALGLQDVPSNLAINSLALILTMYIMAPVGWQIGQHLQQPDVNLRDTGEPATQQAIMASIDTIRSFLDRNTHEPHKEFFASSARRLWADDMGVEIHHDDMLILIPAFTTSELTAAFQAAFLLYLPFLAIDLIVANLLLALGMMMLSPLTVSLPFKLLLFVAVDGWTRLLQNLILSYS